MTKSFLLGAAVAGLCLSASASQDSKPTKSSQATAVEGQCHGVNSCKGKSDCGGKHHSCHGQNSCKGKGWNKMAKADCEEKGGTFKQ